MKKLMYLIVFTAVFVLIFTGCAKEPAEVQDETSTEEAAAMQFEPGSINIEDFTGEAKPIDFVYPQTLDEAKSFIAVPDYDDTKTENGTETYLKDGKKVAEKKTNANGDIASMSIYGDGEVLVREAVFTYGDTSVVEIDSYKDGESNDKYRMEYFANGTVMTASHLYSEGDTPMLDAYLFDENGGIASYFDYESIMALASGVATDYISSLLGG